MNPRTFAYEANALPTELLRMRKKQLAGLAGLEPAPTRLEDERSNPSELQTPVRVEATEGVEPSTCCLRDSRSAGWSYVAAGNFRVEDSTRKIRERRFVIEDSASKIWPGREASRASILHKPAQSPFWRAETRPENFGSR